MNWPELQIAAIYPLNQEKPHIFGSFNVQSVIFTLLGFAIRAPPVLEAPSEEETKVLIPNLKAKRFSVGRYTLPVFGLTVFATAVVNGLATVSNPPVIVNGRLKSGYIFNRNTKVLSL